MPNLAEFNAPELSIRPSEIGAEAMAAAGRRGGAFFNQVAEDLTQLGSRVGSTVKAVGDIKVDADQHKEINHGAATFATLTDNLTNQWNDEVKNADPNDPSVAAKFKEKVLEPALEQFGTAFNTEGGQNWAEHHVESLRNHFFQKTSADMATMAGIAVKQNVATATTQATNTAYTDPSSVPFLLDSVGHSVEGIVGSSPNLRGADAARVRAEVSESTRGAIVKAGFMGAISKSSDPEAVAQKWINQYPDLINGAEAQQFAKAAKVQAKANAAADKQNLLLQKQLEDQAMHAGSNKIISDNVSIDPQSGKPVIKPEFYQQTLDLLRKHPDAPNGASTARTMMDWAEAQQNKELKAVDNPTVTSDLSTRMFSADNPTSTLDLMKARASGQISDHTFTVMNGLVKELEQSPLKGPVYEDTMKAVKDALIVNVPGLSGKDSVGVQNYARFVQAFIPQYLKESRAGTLPPNALDTSDPKSMISQAMAPFKRSQADRMRDYINGARSEPQGKPAPVVAPPTKVSTPADAQKLAPGTRYETPDGKVYVR